MQNSSLDTPQTLAGYPLSPQQTHLRSLQQAASGQPFRVQVRLNIAGKLDRAAFKEAFEKVVWRYEILRTNFQCLPGMTVPLQAIGTEFDWRDRDFSDRSPEAQAAALNQLWQTLLQTPFDLQNGNLLSAVLVKQAPHQHALFLSLPALCADSVTVENLIGEISQIYAGNGEELDPEPLQYPDLAAWLAELLEDEETAEGRNYWQQQDFTVQSGLRLPGERLSTEFQPQRFTLTPVGVGKLQALTGGDSASIAAFYLTCWKILLWRLSGDSEVMVGIAGDDRNNYAELASALGLLVREFPCKSQLNAPSTCKDVWQEIRERLQQASQLQEYFSWDMLNQSWYPYSFAFESPRERWSAGDLTLTIEQKYEYLSRFHLKLTCQQQDDQLIAQIDWDTSAFDLPTIERLAERWQALVRSALDNPDRAIGRLNLLSDREREQLLVELNQTDTEVESSDCIHQLFEAWVERTPDSVAVVFEDRQLTYAELNERANQVAAQLQRLGVQPETPVALTVDRSLDAIVGLLGILKAGGAYLPIDPSLPQARQVAMLAETQAPVVLTQRHLAETLPPGMAQVLCIDGDWDGKERPTPSNVTADNLAYIIYTSGSTGQPKGVAVEHRQLLNYVSAILQQFQFPPGTRFATVSTLAADLGNTAIFAALCGGGCLHIIDRDRALNPQSFAEYCRTHAIDCLKIVPSHLEALLSGDAPADILPRRFLILGGEAASWKLIDNVRQLAPHCQIINHYGPTEATVGVLTYPIPGEANPATAAVPLGRPLINTQVYLLDSEQQLVPFGVAGELYIGGANLARGYFNRPELTQERFIPNPFDEGKSPQLYKTGDLARYLSDGTLEFLGRTDEQVKVRGFRVELGEIEVVLREHPAVSRAVVIFREGRLLAYIVPVARSAVSDRELQEALRARLPEYMIPAAFVCLETLPLTPNGKVDRQALPDPETSDRHQFIAPRTPTETTLSEIWSQLLGVETIGIHDNFFALGGDSILSIQAIAKAKQAGIHLTPKQLFECQTIAKLAAVANTSEVIRAEQGLVTGAHPLTPIQQRFFEQELPNPHHWNQAVLLEVSSPLNLEHLERATRELLVHHDALRLRYQHARTGWQAMGMEPDGTVPLTRIDLSTLPEAEQTAAIEEKAAEFQTALDITTGSLLQVVWFDLGSDRPSRLLVIIHHLAVDGISWRILLEDLETAYRQLSRGEAIALPPKTTAYKQWAEQLREYARSPELQAEGDYWLTDAGVRKFPPNEEARSVSPTKIEKPALPLDNPDGTNTVADSRTLSVRLSAAETQALLQEVPQAYQTQIDEVLLAALAQAFARWTGAEHLRIDLEGHGREALFPDLDLSRTVGWFTSIFPVCLSVTKDAPPEIALTTVKEQLRSIPKRGIGYGILRYLHAEVGRQLQALPEAEAIFNYLGQFDQTFSESSLWKLARENRGSTRHLQATRPYLLEINGLIVGGQLRLDWTYSERLHHRETIDAIAQTCLKVLSQLIAHCQSPEAGGYTPSDFPQARLNQSLLDRLITKFNDIGGKQ